jgi:hypothetical protein
MLEPFEGIIGIQKILSTQGGKSLYDFIYMYLLGAYMRRHHIFSSHEISEPDSSAVKTSGGKSGQKKSSVWNRPFIYLVGFLLLGLVNVLIVYIYPDEGITSVIGYNDNPVVVLQCTCLFRFFERLDLRRFVRMGNVINYISAGNLGIYMIHEHPLIRSLIWNEIFEINSVSFYSKKGYLFLILLIILVIYIICWCIDWIRRMIFKLIAPQSRG